MTVNLPTAPKVIDDKNPTKIDEVGVDSVGTVLVSRFTAARQFQLQGSIWVPGSTNASLESTYLAPLRSMARQAVTITDPDSQFSGNWLMDEVDFHREQEGNDVRYTYTLAFKQASSLIVL
jgi:hypothetical protein